ncbi:MAG: fused MFS/spermidine synthase, partial [Patescibacteria group bacterium]
MKKYNLEVIVFICGAVVMVLEITGSRVLAPFLGTSLFVWTSLIGIILGSLSLGYWLGGRLADKKTSYKIFSFIIFIAAILIAITSFIKNGFLELIQTNISDIRIGSIIAATVLFAPASIFLGMISPYAVKLKLENLEKSGQTVGKLYALSTVGSIVGTFLAGFWLLAFLGNTKLLMILAIVLALTSLLASGSNKKIKIIVALLILGNFTTYSLKENKLAQAGIIELDTDYNHVQIYKSRDPKTDQQVQTLDLGRASHSSMFLENDDLVFEYTKFYNLAKHFRP